MNTAAWFDFNGQVVVVCGGGGAIGRELAVAFSRHGATVVVADVDAASAEAVANEADTISAAEVDVSNGTAVEDLIESTWQGHGKIDVLVNTAAIYLRMPSLELTEADFDRVMGINVKGTWLLCQAAGRRMIDRGRGRIINYSSNAGIRGSARQLAYNASKSAVISMTKSLAVEWARTGVTVNAVAPGPTDTALMAPAFTDPAVVEAFAQRIPQGALTTTDVTVGPVLFLASEMAGSITGHTLFADGGMSAT